MRVGEPPESLKQKPSGYKFFEWLNQKDSQLQAERLVKINVA
jgi:hypothetical protein